MLASDFDWRSGRVVFWDLDATARKEDLAQIEFPYDVTLDVGWYGDAFVIVVVYASDWESPALRRRVESLATLPDELRAAIRFADELAATIA